MRKIFFILPITLFLVLGIFFYLLVIDRNPSEIPSNLLDKKVLSDFNEAIKERKNSGFISETTFIGINSAEIKDHQQNKNMLEVTVEFVSEIISCLKDINLLDFKEKLYSLVVEIQKEKYP